MTGWGWRWGQLSGLQAGVGSMNAVKLSHLCRDWVHVEKLFLAQCWQLEATSEDVVKRQTGCGEGDSQHNDDVARQRVAHGWEGGKHDATTEGVSNERHKEPNKNIVDQVSVQVGSPKDVQGWGPVCVLLA